MISRAVISEYFQAPPAGPEFALLRLRPRAEDFENQSGAVDNLGLAILFQDCVADGG